jgi:hypothetical protein
LLLLTQLRDRCLEVALRIKAEGSDNGVLHEGSRCRRFELHEPAVGLAEFLDDLGMVGDCLRQRRLPNTGWALDEDGAGGFR